MKHYVLLILTALVTLGPPASAQTLQETQAPVPIGGADTRSLPNRSALPPMFGANLFSSGPSVATQLGAAALGSIQKGAAPATAASPAGGLSKTAPPGDNSIAAALAAQAGAGQNSNIASTTIQLPAGMPALDPSHVIVPGDVVQIHIFGATTLDQQATVDSNGDIFLPTIGPIHVGGTTAGNLQSAVAAALSTIYNTNAMVYATLASAVPVNVFVTGGVVAPGQYAQPSTASIITFLQSAGGIDPNRGSYRNIEVLRGGRTVANFDLYQFLLRGASPTLPLRERDTILVHAQGPTVAALGDVSGVYRYELLRPKTGAELIALARPYPDATQVNLIGVRNGRPVSLSYSLQEFRGIRIESGDVVTFTADVPTNMMTVKLDGRTEGPTTLVLTRSATLFDLLPYISVDPYFSDPSSIYVRRVSVAQAQKRSIEEAVQRLKSAVVTSPTITEEQAKMQQQEAQIVFQFADQLNKVQPEGRLVVAYDGKLQNVRLEDNDVVVLPSRTDLVLVSGEVRVPQAMVWVRGANLEDYIKIAGGFTERANESQILVIRPSGQTLTGSKLPIQPGDRIIVLPAPSNWTLPFVKDITQILYQVAVTTGLSRPPANRRWKWIVCQG